MSPAEHTVADFPGSATEEGQKNNPLRSGSLLKITIAVVVGTSFAPPLTDLQSNSSQAGHLEVSSPTPALKQVTRDLLESLQVVFSSLQVWRDHGFCSHCLITCFSLY